MQTRNRVNCLLPLPHLFQEHISGWGCILMTMSHSWRCCNTLYMYKVDLLWVWSEWGVSIIIHSMMQARNRVNCLLPFSHLFQEHISGWGCILMTNSHNRRCQNASYRYEEDMIGVRIGWGVLIIVYSMIQVRKRESPTVATRHCDS